jgi:hypothetical protein
MAKKGTFGNLLTGAQAKAIGHLTINFNWMEHGVEVLISTILSNREHGLAEPLLAPMRFAAKVDVLQRLVKELSQHYVPTPTLERAYLRFAAEMKASISQAKELNTFRNTVVHWRPFLNEDAQRRRFQIEASAKAIEAKALEMEGLGMSLVSRALYLRKGDYSLTFGSHTGRDNSTSE